MVVLDVDWAHGNIIMQGIVHEPSKEMEELGTYRHLPQSRMLFQKLPRYGRIDRHIEALGYIHTCSVKVNDLTSFEQNWV